MDTNIAPKLAVLTCVLYLSIIFLIEITSIVLAYFFGSFAIAAKPWGWGLLCGVIWLISFTLAWHVAHTEILTRLSNFRS